MWKPSRRCTTCILHSSIRFLVKNMGRRICTRAWRNWDWHLVLHCLYNPLQTIDASVCFPCGFPARFPLLCYLFHALPFSALFSVPFFRILVFLVFLLSQVWQHELPCCQCGSAMCKETLSTCTSRNCTEKNKTRKENAGRRLCTGKLCPIFTNNSFWPLTSSSSFQFISLFISLHLSSSTPICPFSSTHPPLCFSSPRPFSAPLPP